MNLTNQLEALIKSQKAYEKAHKEAEKALENYHKADADIYLSRAEVINLLLICVHYMRLDLEEDRLEFAVCQLMKRRCLLINWFQLAGFA